MDNNEKIHNGKETSVIEYMKRIDTKAKVLKSYENQKAMRTCFYEEFKIEGFKFITLLFESMIRLLATMLDHQDMAEFGQSQPSYMGTQGASNVYSRNLTRFLENRSRKIDKFISHCIGWPHVFRSIEVLEMTLRDLVNKIVPSSAMVRDMVD